MKNFIETIKKKDRWIYGVIGLLCISLFFNTFWNADEIWNYNFAKGVLNGLVPYRDINMVSTSLSIYITAVFLKLFGNGLFAYRIAGYVLMVLTFSLVYMLTKRIAKNRLFAFMAVFMLFAINISVYIYNYNNVALVMVLIALLLELDVASDNDSKWKNVAIALSCGLIPLLKQSIGLVMLCAHGLVCLYYIFFEKREWKIYGVRILISGIPGVCYLVYLILSNTLMDFIDYAILGISDFTYRISLIEYMLISPINFIIGVLPIGVVLYGLYDMVIQKNGTGLKYVFTIYVISWLFIASYPMCDEQHFFIGLIPVASLGFLYIGDKEKHKEIFFYTNLFLGVLLLALAIVKAPDLRDYPCSEIKHYEGIPMDASTKENIEDVCEYIEQAELEGMEVYIAYEYAAMYMIPLDQYTKNWDLLLVGNLGTTSIEKMLDVENNSIFLVPKQNYKLNKMAHIELMDYIRENYVYIDEVQQFDVYKKGETK